WREEGVVGADVDRIGGVRVVEPKSLTVMISDRVKDRLRDLCREVAASEIGSDLILETDVVVGHCSTSGLPDDASRAIRSIIHHSEARTTVQGTQRKTVSDRWLRQPRSSCLLPRCPYRLLLVRCLRLE